MLKNCDWCGDSFTANVSYQIYCGADCRVESTRQNNLAKQKEKLIKSRAGKDRRCGTCSKPLSVYNDETYCSSCIGDNKSYKKFLRNIR